MYISKLDFQGDISTSLESLHRWNPWHVAKLWKPRATKRKKQEPCFFLRHVSMAKAEGMHRIETKKGSVWEIILVLERVEEGDVRARNEKIWHRA